MTSKQKRISISNEQKFSLKKKSQEDRSMTHEQLKNWFNQQYQSSITRSTVTKILKKFEIDKNKINLKYKKNRKAKHPLLEKTLYEWVLIRENMMTLTDGVLIEMAKKLKDKMEIKGDTNFSNGWVQRFKSRYNISYRIKEGEGGSADIDTVNTQLPKLKKEIEKYDLNDVFNFDECALFHRLEPDKTLATKRLSGRKKNKERVTIGLCSNATGTDKLNPIVIGKCKNPRCFKNKNIKNFGISYTYNGTAWMTAAIFRK